jgi:transcriptional regulator with XRE-family HTH domain
MPRRREDQAEAARIARRLGSRLRLMRAKNRWTQDELSERIQLTSEAYARVERGHALPSFPTLLRLCAVLETRPDELLVDAANELRALGVHGEPLVDGPDREEMRELVAGIVLDLRRMTPQAVRNLAQFVRSIQRDQREGAPGHADAEEAADSM